MQINILPIRAPYEYRFLEKNMVFVKRGDDNPYVLMKNVMYRRNDPTQSTAGYTITGNFVDNHTMTELQDDDTLLVYSGGDHLLSDMKEISACYCQMYAISDNVLASFDGSSDILSMAEQLRNDRHIVFMEEQQDDEFSTILQLSNKLSNLYSTYPAYEHIMLNDGNGTPKALSLGDLIAQQPEDKQHALIALLKSLPSNSGYLKTHVGVLKRIMELCSYDNAYSLLTQEEQISAFIEFSKQVAGQKEELVSDAMIDNMQASAEYADVLSKLSENNLGVSATQQFNVLQAVGYFSGTPRRRILYNLSDMGAGKTLMTVESIYMMDLKQISTWVATANDEGFDGLTIHDIRVPDKHIVAPTLSVTSSWIDTFKLFYDVEEVEEGVQYELTCSFDGVEAHSTIYVSSFTVKNGNIFATTSLPSPYFDPYLIIDEVHQLIKKKIARTKFFASGFLPVDHYNTFVLSGTMSNLQTHEWYNYLSLMGFKLDNLTPAQCETQCIDLRQKQAAQISNSASNVRTGSHRYFDDYELTTDNYYNVPQPKSMTRPDEYFYTRYGSQIFAKGHYGALEEVLTRNVPMRFVNPVEVDAINFELFYEIVGASAITAQSVQVAEELFGEQKTQHASDIIKTVSPLTDNDISILKVLHRIAADSDKYKSLSISKAINNGILNLNDGLQTQNLYEMMAKFAEKNVKFFGYLASLDVNVLEQLQASGLIQSPKLEDTQKFKVLKDILEKEKDETFLIVVNDFYALKSLSEALGIEHLSKTDLKDELNYQNVLDALFEKQSIVVVTQDMIKSSLDLVQANRLVQYQLNTEISDIIQTQNRINRIGQTRETKGYYIATDQLQENLIELFLESYRNIRVAHKGIVELFTDITQQINVVNDYLEKAFMAIDRADTEVTDTEVAEAEVADTNVEDVFSMSDLSLVNEIPVDAAISVNENGYARALLYPQGDAVSVFVPLETGAAFLLGVLNNNVTVTTPTEVLWDLDSQKRGGVAA